MKRSLMILFFLFVISDIFSLVHIIGDGHVFFSFMPPQIGNEISIDYNYKIINHPNFFNLSFVIYWLPSSRMYTIKKHIDLLFRDQQFLNKLSYNDVCIFSLGQVDSKGGIQELANKCQCSTEQIIESLIANYGFELERFSNNFKEFELKIVLLGILPPQLYLEEDSTMYQDFPIRLSNVIRLNIGLKKLAEQKGFLFLDVYPLFALPSGEIDMHFSDACNHVKRVHNDKIWSQYFKIMY